MKNLIFNTNHKKNTKNKYHIIIILHLLITCLSHSNDTLPKKLEKITAEKDIEKSEELMKLYIKESPLKISRLPTLELADDDSIKKISNNEIIFVMNQQITSSDPLNIKLGDIHMLLSQCEHRDFSCTDSGYTLAGTLKRNQAFFITDLNEHVGHLDCHSCANGSSLDVIENLKITIGNGYITRTWSELMRSLKDEEVVSLYEGTGWSEEEKNLIEKTLHIPPLSKLEYSPPRTGIPSQYPPKTTGELIQQLAKEEKKSNQTKRSGKPRLIEDIQRLRIFLSIAETFRPYTDSDLSSPKLITSCYRKSENLTDRENHVSPLRERSKTQ